MTPRTTNEIASGWQMYNARRAAQSQDGIELYWEQNSYSRAAASSHKTTLTFFMTFSFKVGLARIG
jgi:hypothetical protein